MLDPIQRISFHEDLQKSTEVKGTESSTALGRKITDASRKSVTFAKKEDFLLAYESAAKSRDEVITKLGFFGRLLRKGSIQTDFLRTGLDQTIGFISSSKTDEQRTSAKQYTGYKNPEAAAFLPDIFGTLNASGKVEDFKLMVEKGLLPDPKQFLTDLSETEGGLDKLLKNNDPQNVQAFLSYCAENGIIGKLFSSEKFIRELDKNNPQFFDVLVKNPLTQTKTFTSLLKKEFDSEKFIGELAKKNPKLFDTLVRNPATHTEALASFLDKESQDIKKEWDKDPQRCLNEYKGPRTCFRFFIERQVELNSSRTEFTQQINEARNVAGDRLPSDIKFLPLTEQHKFFELQIKTILSGENITFPKPEGLSLEDQVDRLQKITALLIEKKDIHPVAARQLIMEESLSFLNQLSQSAENCKSPEDRKALQDQMAGIQAKWSLFLNELNKFPSSGLSNEACLVEFNLMQQPLAKLRVQFKDISEHLNNSEDPEKQSSLEASLKRDILDLQVSTMSNMRYFLQEDTSTTVARLGNKELPIFSTSLRSV